MLVLWMEVLEIKFLILAEENCNDTNTISLHSYGTFLRHPTTPSSAALCLSTHSDRLPVSVCSASFIVLDSCPG